MRLGPKRGEQPPSLDGSVVLISGAGSGIGAGTAKQLAERGARLVLCDVDEAGLKDTVSAVGEDRAVAEVLDVRDLAALERLVATAVDRFGGVDVVVANAGVASFGSVLHVDPEAFRRVIDINVTGVFHTVRAALPSVVERKGYVLVVSSLAAFTATPAMSAYHASKAGAENFANSLRLEVAHLGVDVGSAHMCWVDTPMVQDAKTELSGFAKAISQLPPPLNRTTDLDTCVDAFVDGIARRSRRIYVPGWVGTISRMRSAVNSPAGQRPTLKQAPQAVADADADVARYGRSLSARMTQHLDAAGD
jgi:NAD(P)-dependent dehydrogenase (short-subunit alcohol dehydrogenase family)